MPGCGKSTQARKVASDLNLKLIDLDYEIEKHASLTINEIFTIHGEEYFRRLESTFLVQMTRENSDFVMATGGGAACFFDNIDYMNHHGITIYIKIGVDELLNRLSGTGKDKRPLLKGRSATELKKELENKLCYRKTFYEKAKITFDGEKLDPTIVELIYDYKNQK